MNLLRSLKHQGRFTPCANDFFLKTRDVNAVPVIPLSTVLTFNPIVDTLFFFRRFQISAFSAYGESVFVENCWNS